MTKNKTNQLLPGEIGTPATVLGFDTNTPLTAEQAKRFYDDGYRFCLRYVGRTEMKAIDLSSEEAANILSAGLALMPVQHVLESPWVPTAALGAEYGGNAALFTSEIGFPKGVNIWCDLEGVERGAEASIVIEYCNNWYDEVNAAGYVPGLYVGANCGLTGQQLYRNLKFQHYWKSGSKVPEVEKRGYQLFQQTPSVKVNGMSIDKNTAVTDQLRGQVQWLVIK